MLTAVSEAEFATLRDALDVSDSVLSTGSRRDISGEGLSQAGPCHHAP
jgi:hypothetical protein